MNPSEKGWLEKYVQFRSSFPIEINEPLTMGKDNILYKVVQPTGLLYGHPIHAPDIRHPKEQRWNNIGKMKVVLLESFFHSAAIKLDSKPKSELEWGEFYSDTVKTIGHFYEVLNPPKKHYNWIPFLSSEKKDDLLYAEEALRKNLLLRSHWENFWASLFQNSLLFLDTYYFGEWLAGRFHNIKWHKDAIKIMVLKVLAAAAHSNSIIASQERHMFFSFLSSAKLPKGHEKKLKTAFKDGVQLDQIDLRQADTWLLKKYVLELAILMIWSDQKIEATEKEFLLNLSNKLGFQEDELLLSLIAIESFVVENWKEVYFLQSKHSYQVIGETIIERFKQIVSKNKILLAENLKESQELLQILEGSKTVELTEEDKENVRAQLLDALKSIPVFKSISLPSSFLTLPVLLKIIPKDLFPSTFRG